MFLGLDQLAAIVAGISGEFGQARLHPVNAGLDERGRMSDDAASQKAITELNEATIDGRTIKVMEAKPKEDRPARNFNSGNSYNKNRY
jgi:hypothetical protein